MPKKNISVVAINDVLFLEKEDHLAHQAKVAINNATLLKDEIDNPNVSSEQYFKTEEELTKYHEFEPLKNTFEVAKLCNVFLKKGNITFLPMKFKRINRYQNIWKIFLETNLKNT